MDWFEKIWNADKEIRFGVVTLVVLCLFAWAANGFPAFWVNDESKVEIPKRRTPAVPTPSGTPFRFISDAEVADLEQMAEDMIYRERLWDKD
jgi:hypothetical protein